MSLDIQFRESESSPARTVDYNELKACIRRGEVGPKALVCDRILTGNQWWTLEDLNFFHNNSPKDYAPGERLQKRWSDASFRREAEARSFQLHRDYIQGNLIDQRFDLAPLEKLLNEAGVQGLTRLYVLRSFEPERIFTFLFGLKSIRIEVAQGRTSLWYSLPQVGSVNGIWKETVVTPFDPAQILRANAEVPLQDAPEPFNIWQSTVAATQRAPSCWAATLDGVGYRHQLCSSTESFVAEWDDPRSVEHSAQTMLVGAYYDFIVLAKLGEFWQGR